MKFGVPLNDSINIKVYYVASYIIVGRDNDNLQWSKISCLVLLSLNTAY